MLSVIVADPNRLIRRAFVELLAAEPDISLAGEASNRGHLMELVGTAKPDVLVVDFGLLAAGEESILRLSETAPGMRIVVVSHHEHAGYALEALSWGASGYVLKDDAAGELVTAIRKAAPDRPSHGSLRPRRPADTVFGGEPPDAGGGPP